MNGEQKVSILMVDDHPENLLALEAVLAAPHYRLIRANSGEEALKWVLKEDFALILLDVQMPGMNGFETATLIKARERSKHIPILFITAISQATEHVLHGYGVGAIDYVFKPFHPETLKLKVEGFVKMYLYHEQIKRQSALLQQQKADLQRTNEQLHRTTAQLRRAEALARVIGETSMDTILTLNEQGAVLAGNPRVVHMFGYTVDMLQGRHISKLLPDFRAQWQVGGLFVETLAQRLDGTCFPADIQIGEADVEEQHIYVCSIRDISERKQQYQMLEQLVEERTTELHNTAEQLRRSNRDLLLSQERFIKIFNASPSLIAIRSLQDWRYIDLNESWLAQMGYTYEEALSQPPDTIHFLIDTEESLSTVQSYKRGETLRNARVSYHTRWGEEREGLLSTEAIEIEGESCLLCVVTDITDRMMLQREMGRLDRLNLIGEMAAGIAHEIRNPMTTVRGFLQMSKSSGSIPAPEYLDLMVQELDRGNAIITEFLTLAKNKTADRKLQVLGNIIEALFPLIQAEALLSDKDIRLELNVCPALYLDEKEIRQLILNLALNGLEAMTPGGLLTIATETVDQHVVLEVRDQGCGIRSEWLDKLGTPFFTTKEKGTGLGLAVCYSVAARHHATIQVKTSEQGTSFFVRFPIQHESSNE